MCANGRNGAPYVRYVAQVTCDKPSCERGSRASYVRPYTVDTLAVDARHGRLLVVTAAPFDYTRHAFTGPALLRVLDLRSGRALGAYPLGVGFRAQLVLDPRADRLAALLDGGSGPPGPDPWGWLPAGVRHRLPFLPPPPVGTTLHPASATIFDTARL